ncbi:acetate/propionate family kinase [Granulosicoccus antarcticus]|uniref:Acetate kinase n=1 Tax=Granulosicoccus antarcticus IMCC3135 TaxID=1192854 RepID=A0A2Z2NZY0_9GAMM|nr:acetate/propionate family kinase [Granulosicoccus antarcticus]ASJ75521.1 Acetate kinase [Granulosicoccus antarcticus IMCC3135]
MNTLVINCGSSSIKYALIDGSDKLLLSGKHERLGESQGEQTHESAVGQILQEISGYPVDVVGHRVVHGGSKHAAPCLIDEQVLADIERHVPDAPMHNPYSLAAIHAAQTALPGVPHVALFDTAFHARMPRRSTTYAIDYEVALKHGIRRYGFHGISHEYAAGIAAQFLQRPLNELRIVTLHLGNGASACAVEFGRSAETSMGHTPLEGLVMGTRSGDVDAGVLLTLLRQGYDVASLDDLLNRKSGLAGLSGLGNDLREIEIAAADGNERCRLAINVFAHRARKYIGAYAAAMGGVDAIVFTGGIGENSASMRGRILQRLEFLGVVLDEDRNRDASVQKDNDYALITTPRSRVEAIVVKTNEELMIARQARRLVSASRPSASMDIPIAVSGRHCHLTRETFAALFGADATPTIAKPLSQPGQFACEERVNLIGPHDRIERVRVLGPLRSVNQVEISRTDEFRLGIDAPVRDSGNVQGSAPITLEGPAGSVTLAEGLICARRHIHMHPDDAERFGLSDKDEVAVAIVGGGRDLVFGDVLIRVKDSYALEMHIDTDEANAAELNRQQVGELSDVDVDQYVVVTTGAASLVSKLE